MLSLPGGIPYRQFGEVRPTQHHQIVPTTSRRLLRWTIGALVLVLGAVIPYAAASPGTVNVSASSVDTGYWTHVHTVTGQRTQGQAITALGDGSVVVAGAFAEKAVFATGPNADDSIVLTSAGEFDVFIARMNPITGYANWASRAGGLGSNLVEAVADTSDDTVIITGYFVGTSQFPTGPQVDDSIVLTSTSTQDIFIAAVDTRSGFFTWAHRAGTVNEVGQQRNSGLSVAAKDDSVIVTGYFEGTATFPTGPGTVVTLDAPGVLGAIFVAAVNPVSGYFLWARSAGGTGIGEGYSVAMTSSKDAVVAGRFTGIARFPTGPGSDDSITVTSTGVGSDLFVARVNTSTGYFEWVQHGSGSNLDSAQAVAVIGDDTVVVTGQVRGTTSFPTGPGDDSIILAGAGAASNVFVAAMNADDSYFAWAQRVESSNFAEGRAIGVSSDDATPIVAGSFGGTATFPTGPQDSVTLVSAGSSDAFVAGVDPATGYFTWAQRAGGSGDAAARALTFLADDTPVVTGEFRSTATFPNSPATDIDVPTQPIDAIFNMFLGLIGPAAPIPPAPTPDPPAPALPPSPPVDVTAVAGDSTAMITWSPPMNSGSFPITTYQAQINPGQHSCLAAAPMVQCEVTGLVNNTTYTASVRALNGAGWGPFSTVSASFTPTAPVTPSILISGTRQDVRGRPGVVVQGRTTAMAGQSVTPRVRLAGQVSYASGLARTVSESETFTWQRRTGKKVYVSFVGDSVRSNRVIVPAR